MPWRYETRSAICERIEARLRLGATITAVLAEPGMPNPRTLNRWAEENLGLRANLDDAKREGRIVRSANWKRQPFKAEVAERLLIQVYRGCRVVDLVKQPEFPNRETFDRWKRESPAFAADLAEAIRITRAERKRRYPYDEARADRLIARVNRGETLPTLLGRPGLPREVELKLWRKARPDFDHAMRMARLGGHRNRSKARTRDAITPDLVEAICQLILAGRSLRQVGQMRDMPHYNTLYKWMGTQPAFADIVRQACLDRDEGLADDALRIAMAMTPATQGVDTARIGAIRRHAGQMAWKPRG